jgi:hypothetical protein
MQSLLKKAHYETMHIAPIVSFAQSSKPSLLSACKLYQSRQTRRASSTLGKVHKTAPLSAIRVALLSGHSLMKKTIIIVLFCLFVFLIHRLTVFVTARQSIKRKHERLMTLRLHFDDHFSIAPDPNNQPRALPCG